MPSGDGVPAYVITRDSDKKQQHKVLHRARLLLWFADPQTDADSIRVNYVHVTSSRHSVKSTENTLPESEQNSMVMTGEVPRELDYGMDLAKFIPGKHSLELLHVGCQAKAALMGVLPTGTGHETAT